MSIALYVIASPPDYTQRNATQRNLERLQHTGPVCVDRLFFTLSHIIVLATNNGKFGIGRIGTSNTHLLPSPPFPHNTLSYTINTTGLNTATKCFNKHTYTADTASLAFYIHRYHLSEGVPGSWDDSSPFQKEISRSAS